MRTHKDDQIHWFLLIAVIILLLYGMYAQKARAEPLDARAVIDEAMTHLDKPYVYATAGDNTFDCTGFTCYCFEQAYGIQLKRSAYEQGYDETYSILLEWCNLKPGDLVYFNTNRFDEDLSDHAGIYIGNGNFIHASSAKGCVVISTLWDGYYNKCFSWGRRVIPNTYKEQEHERTEDRIE